MSKVESILYSPGRTGLHFVCALASVPPISGQKYFLKLKKLKIGGGIQYKLDIVIKMFISGGILDFEDLPVSN